jgi:hypothetical protein
VRMVGGVARWDRHCSLRSAKRSSGHAQDTARGAPEKQCAARPVPRARGAPQELAASVETIP